MEDKMKKVLFLVFVISTLLFSIFVGAEDKTVQKIKDDKTIDKYVDDMVKLKIDEDKGVKDKVKIKVNKEEEKLISKGKDAGKPSGVTFTEIQDDNIDVSKDTKKKNTITRISASG
jgi:glutamyl/glutaminyl-tRNA synthetase